MGTGAILSVMMFTIASAQNIGVGVDANVDLKVKGNATSTSAKTEVRGNATSSINKNEDRADAEDHRSTVSTFVQSLLRVANRDGGIGAEVRAIAQAQNDSASTTAHAMARTEKVGGVKKFLFGGDYKNLGILRSEMVKTRNNIEKLENLLDRTTNTADRAELEAQITVLKNTQVKIEAFIEAHESSFSLLGWLVKPFANK